MFAISHNTAIFSLTTKVVVNDNTSVKSTGSTIRSNRILPGTRAELRDREVRKAPVEPHNSAPVPGCFFAHTARKVGVL